MMKTVFGLSVLVVMLILTGCSTPTQAVSPTDGPTVAPKSVSLKIFAPSSLTDAAKEIATVYEAANPGVKSGGRIWPFSYAAASIHSRRHWRCFYHCFPERHG